ncbi:MAG: 30S ribosomal protein THX [Bacteroidota bacterium]
MGKGDRRSRKSKIVRGTHGKTRPKKRATRLRRLLNKKMKSAAK